MVRPRQRRLPPLRLQARSERRLNQEGNAPPLNRMAVAILALIGLLISTYLLLYKLNVMKTLLCGTGACETVQSSPWADFIGVPVPAWGVAGYLIILALCCRRNSAAFCRQSHARARARGYGNLRVRVFGIPHLGRGGPASGVVPLVRRLGHRRHSHLRRNLIRVACDHRSPTGRLNQLSAGTR